MNIINYHPTRAELFVLFLIIILLCGTITAILTKEKESLESAFLLIFLLCIGYAIVFH